MTTDLLADVGFRARRIEPTAVEQPTRTDLAQVAGECTTFLDQCAAEAAYLRWFPQKPITHRRRSTVLAQILAALRASMARWMPNRSCHASATNGARRKRHSANYWQTVRLWLPARGRQWAGRASTRCPLLTPTDP